VAFELSNRKGATTLGITTFGIMTLGIVIISINMFNIMTLSTIAESQHLADHYQLILYVERQLCFVSFG
jgi:hypothetical protein